MLGTPVGHAGWGRQVGSEATSVSCVPLQANVATAVSAFQDTATFVLVLSAVTVTEPEPRLAPSL